MVQKMNGCYKNKRAGLTNGACSWLMNAILSIMSETAIMSVPVVTVDRMILGVKVVLRLRVCDFWKAYAL
jgi:hypothetical protein